MKEWREVYSPVPHFVPATFRYALRLLSRALLCRLLGHDFPALDTYLDESDPEEFRQFAETHRTCLRCDRHWECPWPTV